MATHVMTFRDVGAGQTVEKQVNSTGSGQIVISETVTTGQTDFLINLDLDVSEIESIWINSTQNVTLETNNGGAPDNTLALKADVPYIWLSATGWLYTNLLTVDITALYITNTSGSTATIDVVVVYDATP